MIFAFSMLAGLSMIISGLAMRSKRKHFTDGSGALFGIGLAMVIVAGVIAPIVYLNNLASVAEMQAFYDETAAVYKQAIDEANNSAIVAGHLPKDKLGEVMGIISAMGGGELVNLDNFSQSSNITELIQDYKNSIRIYNARLTKYRMYRESIWVWPVMPEIPKHLELMSY